MSRMKDLFGDEPYDERDLRKARAARDAGINRVLGNNELWRMEALAEMQKLYRGWTGTAEDIRFGIAPKIGVPTHPNAWGGLMNAAIRRGWFTPTGNWISPRDVKSHSRPTREYRRT